MRKAPQLFDACGDSIPPGGPVLETLNLRQWPGCHMIFSTSPAVIGLRVEATHGGLRITEPVTTDKYGRTWPAFRIQPHYREALEREIAILWGRTA